jgi:hypothetical protein
VQVIYNNKPETNNASKAYNVAGVLNVLLMLHVMLLCICYYYTVIMKPIHGFSRVRVLRIRRLNRSPDAGFDFAKIPLGSCENSFTTAARWSSSDVNLRI